MEFNSSSVIQTTLLLDLKLPFDAQFTFCSPSDAPGTHALIALGTSACSIYDEATKKFKKAGPALKRHAEALHAVSDDASTIFTIAPTAEKCWFWKPCLDKKKQEITEITLTKRLCVGVSAVTCAGTGALVWSSSALFAVTTASETQIIIDFSVKRSLSPLDSANIGFYCPPTAPPTCATIAMAGASRDRPYATDGCLVVARAGLKVAECPLGAHITRGARTPVVFVTPSTAVLCTPAASTVVDLGTCRVQPYSAQGARFQTLVAATALPGRLIMTVREHRAGGVGVVVGAPGAAAAVATLPVRGGRGAAVSLLPLPAQRSSSALPQYSDGLAPLIRVLVTVVRGGRVQAVEVAVNRARCAAAPIPRPDKRVPAPILPCFEDQNTASQLARSPTLARMPVMAPVGRAPAPGPGLRPVPCPLLLTHPTKTLAEAVLTAASARSFEELFTFGEMLLATMTSILVVAPNAINNQLLESFLAFNPPAAVAVAVAQRAEQRAELLRLWGAQRGVQVPENVVLEEFSTRRIDFSYLATLARTGASSRQDADRMLGQVPAAGTSAHRLVQDYECVKRLQLAADRAARQEGAWSFAHYGSVIATLSPASAQPPAPAPAPAAAPAPEFEYELEDEEDEDYFDHDGFVSAISDTDVLLPVSVPFLPFSPILSFSGSRSHNNTCEGSLAGSLAGSVACVSEGDEAEVSPRAQLPEDAVGKRVVNIPVNLSDVEVTISEESEDSDAIDSTPIEHSIVVVDEAVVKTPEYVSPEGTLWQSAQVEAEPEPEWSRENLELMITEEKQ